MRVGEGIQTQELLDIRLGFGEGIAGLVASWLSYARLRACRRRASTTRSVLADAIRRSDRGQDQLQAPGRVIGSSTSRHAERHESARSVLWSACVTLSAVMTVATVAATRISVV